MKTEVLKIAMVFAALLALGFWLAFQFVGPAPPNHLRMSTGGEGGTYFALGSRYAEAFGAEKVTLDVLGSGGSGENLKRLAAGDVDLAFVQGGVGSAADYPHLVGLGRLYLEPLWIVVGPMVEGAGMDSLRGKRLAIGGEDSGTLAVTAPLLDAFNLDAPETERLTIGGKDAVEAFAEGRVDAVLMVTGPASANLKALLSVEGSRLLSLERAEAIHRRWRHLGVLTLPEGAIDLSRNWPGEEVTLVAPAATLVARDDLHPALATLAVQIAHRIHSPGGLIEDPGTFPDGRGLDFPLSDEAERFYRSGAPFLQRYLPFWAAVYVDRLKVLIVPLIGLMLPLMRILPPVWRWRVRSRIYRWYRDLMALEVETQSTTDDAARMAALEKLDALESEVRNLKVPLSYADEAYALRVHLNLVRSKIANPSLADGA